MPRAGDIVTVDFPGIRGIKRRPAVIVSTDIYHGTRPDLILGLVTSNLAGATAPTDYVLQDWHLAGLHTPSAFRAFLVTLPATSINIVGHLSDRDWQQVQGRLKMAIAVG
ncbi:MAG: type II toxin-antitoxin system PemK/MazF family toxin [Chloroflexi bacterium]|nr:type II toxin-antitoxin system PemK/MazF family toxin [Chloroflexota bacterium]